MLSKSIYLSHRNCNLLYFQLYLLQKRYFLCHRSLYSTVLFPCFIFISLPSPSYLYFISFRKEDSIEVICFILFIEIYCVSLTERSPKSHSFCLSNLWLSVRFYRSELSLHLFFLKHLF